MFIVTNREIDESKKGLKIFGTVPNSAGPNELRLAHVSKSGNGFTAEVLDDVLSADEVASINEEFGLELDVEAEWYATLRVAVSLLSTAEESGKHVLFFVHGYNNDLSDIVSAAQGLEDTYNVVCVVFSWPSNGGGVVSGTLSYLSDKDDARVSATAFNRFANFVRKYHELISASRENKLLAKAMKKHPDNLVKAQELVGRLIDERCKVTLNLVCHSMGNYLLKYSLIPESTAFAKMTFDNICLVAADTNSERHEDWIDKIEFGNRLYVVINENDYALAWSRRKPGDEQKVRLGHSLSALNSQNAKYINVTKADWVGNSHSYFLGDAVDKNLKLKLMFKEMFEGGVAEDNSDVGLEFRSDLNAYEL